MTVYSSRLHGDELMNKNKGIPKLKLMCMTYTISQLLSIYNEIRIFLLRYPLCRNALMVDNKDQTEHKNRHIDDLCKAMMKKTIRK